MQQKYSKIILSILGCLSIILLLFVNRESVVAQTSSTQKFSPKNQASKQNPSVSKAQYTLLQPFKDPLFSYKSIIEQEADGKYSLISYSQTRDLEERDTIPEKKVSFDYVDLTGVNKYRKEKTFSY